MQTLQNNRVPFDGEVDAEVAKEVKQLEEAKRRPRGNYSTEIEEVRDRVFEVEANVSKLGTTVADLSKTMSTSLPRLEAMMEELLGRQVLVHGSTSEDVVRRSPSLQAGIVTSALTSGTTKALNVVQQSVPGKPSTVGLSDFGEGIVADMVTKKEVVSSIVSADVVGDVSGDKVKQTMDVAEAVCACERDESEDDVYDLTTVAVPKQSKDDIYELPKLAPENTEEAVKRGYKRILRRRCRRPVLHLYIKWTSFHVA